MADDTHVVTDPDGLVAFESSTVDALLTPNGEHLADPSKLMAADLGLGQRKLPSALEAAIVLAAEGSAGPTASVPTAGAALGGTGVVNGDFSVSSPTASGFGWETLGGASVQSGHGVLTEDPSHESRFDQTLTAPAGATSLVFAIDSTHFDVPGVGPQDAFEVALLDPQSMQPLGGTTGVSNTDALLSLQADGTVLHAGSVKLTALNGGATQVTIDLGNVSAGEALKLYFDLLGFGATGSRVAVSDVHFGYAQPPVAQPDTVQTDENTPVTFDPRNNDTSPSGQPLTVEFTTAPAHGSVFVGTDGRVTYIPSAEYFGADSFGYQVSDGSNNSLAATVTISVVDVTPPQLVLPADQTFEATGPSGAVVHYTGATATDDAGPVTLVYSVAPDSTFALGTTTVTVTATDGVGNVSTGTFDVTVQDTTAPVLTVPGNVTLEAAGPDGAVANYSATATDLVTASPTITYSVAPGSTFALGTTTVSVTAEDAAGNVSTGSFNVLVRDTTPPVLTVPSDMTLEATGPAGAVASFVATATDLVTANPTIAYSVAPGSTFASGTTTVSVTAEDAAGNVSTGSFNVLVRDTTPPVLTVPSDMTVEATSPAGAVVSFVVSASDAVTLNPAVTYSQASGTVFSLGVTPVLVTATDQAGNSTSETFQVDVVDTTPPTLTVPSDLTLEATGPAGAVATFIATASDLVTLSPTISYSVAPGSTFALGTTTVTVTAEDAAGNVSTGSFNVLVRDTTPPVLTVPADMTLEATGPGGAVATFVASASDLVTAVPTITYSVAPGSTFALGSTTVLVTARDAAGNVAKGSLTSWCAIRRRRR